ncbi:YopX family protein [Listeria monocytogenes]|uniref:YopX family protein n=1 Tax=Listeria monocytogenes TaxID=1639 RepID=UPI001F25C883|nr:YopX family protein [Listeria monocytogenes]MCF2016138.1 YopX family protein [Listeria monocytogenes]
MRQIEFRAQNVNGVWVCGNFSILKKKIGNVDAGSYISNSAGEPFAYKIRPETVSQFTGLKDKNGKKIFEGDIVEIIEIDAFGNLDWNRLKGKVMFSEGAWLVTDNRSFAIPLWSEINEIKVIGNIHENPELLEVATC